MTPTPINSIRVTYTSLLQLAIPAMLSALLNNTYRIIDQYSVKWLGTDAQAAIGSSTFILIAAYALFYIISGGVGPLVARATGAKEPEKVRKLVGQAIYAAGLMGCIFCCTMIVLNTTLSQVVGLQDEAAREMETYLLWIGITGLFFSFGPLIDAIYIATGNTKFPMLLQLVSTALNALLNWLFIYQMEMGIAGAAVASGASRGVTSIVGLWFLYRDFSPIHKKDEQLKRIIKIGAPVSMGIASYAFVYWGILKTSLSPLGPHVNAGLGIGFSVLEGFSWPLYSGIMVAVSSLIGRQLGAKDEKNTTKTIQLALSVSIGLGILITILFLLFSKSICLLFTNDPQTLEQAVLYGHILAWSQVFVALEALFEGVLGGSGDTKTLFWISMPLNVIRIPLSYYLAIHLGLGAVGIWWAINISTYLKALTKGYFVWGGKWKSVIS